MVPVFNERKFLPPDGGWGWAVVFGAALTNTFNQSILSIYGLLFGVQLELMGETTVSAALVANIMLLMTSVAGLLAGPLLKIYSVRAVTVWGSLLASAGLIGASFATQLWHFIATYSIFTGIGIGLLQPATFVAVTRFFSRRRGRAVGISMAGTGLGQMLMPQVVRFLLQEYAFQGTARLLGALALHGVVGAVLFQPVSWHRRRETCPESQPLLTSSSSTRSYGLQDKEGKVVTLGGKEKTDIDNNTLTETNKEELRKNFLRVKPIDSSGLQPLPAKPQGICRKVSALLDLDLLQDLTFLNIIFAFGLGFTSNQIFNMLFPFFLQQEEGLTLEQTAMCMSGMAAADILGRTCVPFVTDRFRISARVTFLWGCACLTLARLVLCAQQPGDYQSLLMASCLCGFFRSAIVVNQNLACAEYCGKEHEQKLAAAVGLVMMVKGLAILPLGQLLGWVRDYTHSYVACINAQSALLVIVIFMWTPEMIYKRCTRKHVEDC